MDSLVTLPPAILRLGHGLEEDEYGLQGAYKQEIFCCNIFVSNPSLSVRGQKEFSFRRMDSGRDMQYSMSDC